MAVTVQTIANGPRNLIVNVYVAGSNSDAVVVDVSALGISTNLTLVEAQWSLTGASALLEWDATTDGPFLELCEGSGFILVPEGITNNSGTGKTGDVLITNSDSLTSGTIVLKFHR